MPPGRTRAALSRSGPYGRMSVGDRSNWPPSIRRSSNRSISNSAGLADRLTPRDALSQLIVPRAHARDSPATTCRSFLAGRPPRSRKQSQHATHRCGSRSTRKWKVTEALVKRAERVGSPVLVVAVDVGTPTTWEPFLRLRRTDMRQCDSCHGRGPQDFLARPRITTTSMSVIRPASISQTRPGARPCACGIPSR